MARNPRQGTSEKLMEVADKPMSAADYFLPPELGRTTPQNKKVLLVGQCLLDSWPHIIERKFAGCTAEHLLYNNLSKLPERTADEIRQYAFQVIGIPTRAVFYDIYDISIMSAQYAHLQDRDRLLEKIKRSILTHVDLLIKYNADYGLETYFVNFMTPQFATLGRLLPRYGAGNLIYVFEEANKFLDQTVGKYNNTYLIDIDNLANVFGKRFIMDDGVWITSHGGFLNDSDFSHDTERLQIPSRVTQQYELNVDEFIHVVWNELFAMHSIANAQQDSVKLVITDLDGTLWRGVIGDQDVSVAWLEGWPLGYIEALSILKQRGVLIGIISNNTESIVEGRWEEVMRGKLRLSDFAVKRINWEPKVVKMQEILADVNLLPRNVVFIDDNPVERAAMVKAFPEMRVLGDNPYVLKRVLLWSPETQVPFITTESAKRTEMIQAQSKRNADMKAMSREEFLKSLKLKVSLVTIGSEDDPRFKRSFELINKTNQFNTNGKRWTAGEIGELFRADGHIVAFDVVDIYTAYGLVGVLMIKDSEILQFVMSCRVIGLEVETAVVKAVAERVQARYGDRVAASIIETPANIVCRDVYKRMGFEEAGGRWVLNRRLGEGVPSHINLEWTPNRPDEGCRG